MNIDFKWTDNLVAEFIQSRLHIVDSASFDLIEQFKESKQHESEWDILSYLSSTYPDRYIIDKNHIEWNHAVIKNMDIYSVQRKEDGEIFKLNDRVWPHLTIKSFYFPKEYEARYGECSLAVIFNEPNANYCFKDLKHRKLLLTSSDGIDYYEGQMKDIYGVHTKEGYNYIGAWHVDGHPEFYPALRNHYEHFFSTKEAAEKWVLYNKPLLSLNEIKNIGQTDPENIYFKRLIYAAKNNLNK